MKNFKPHTSEELLKLNIQEGCVYKIEYINKDYFNGDENLEISQAKALKMDDKFTFLVTDPYGMEIFVNEARVIIE
jgi:hypothetical protein